jgi:hypothetical protein
LDAQEKSTYLSTALQGRATDVLHGIPKSATYEETLQALDYRFGEEHFAAEYRNQFKVRTQKVGESLQDFATAIQQLARRAYPALPEEHIRRETGKAFVAGIEDSEIKLRLLLGGQETLREALRQALELHSVLTASRFPSTPPPNPAQGRKWNYVKTDRFLGKRPYGRAAANDRYQHRDERPPRDTRKPPKMSESRPSIMSGKREIETIHCRETSEGRRKRANADMCIKPRTARGDCHVGKCKP